MVFDSCFSGSLFSLVRAVPEDISEKSAFPVRQYITAGSEDETVPDRSIFKRCFLVGLQGDADLTKDGYITGSELGLYLSDNVIKYTKRRQHPQYGKINNPDLDRGDFIFVQKVSETEADPLGDERRRIAEERERLKQEWELLQAEKQLIEERELLESERERLEKEKQKLAAITPQPTEVNRVRVGVLTTLRGTYLRQLMSDLRGKPDRELMLLTDSIGCDSLDVDNVRGLGQKYQIDMLICIRHLWSKTAMRVVTKLFDISGQSLVKKTALAGLYKTGWRAPEWEKKLVNKQIGPIEKMIEDISRKKR
jgi:hypothetical protein